MKIIMIIFSATVAIFYGILAYIGFINNYKFVYSNIMVAITWGVFSILWLRLYLNDK